MSLVLFLVVTVVSTGLGLGLRSRPSLSTGVGLVGLAAAAVGRGRPRPGRVVVVGGGALATCAYLRLFLVLGSVIGLALAVSGWPAAHGATRRPSRSASLRRWRCARPPRSAGGRPGRHGRRPVRRPGHPGPERRAGRGDHRHPGDPRAVVVAGALAIAATAWFGRDLSGLTRPAGRVRARLPRLRPGCRAPLRCHPLPPVGRPSGRRRPGDGPADPDRVGPAVAGPRRDRLGRHVGHPARDRSRRRSPVVLGDRDRVDRAGGRRGLRPGRRRARPRLLDHRRRRRRHPGARCARPRRLGTRQDRGSSPSSSPAARSPRGPPGSVPASGPVGSPTCAAGRSVHRC